MATKLLLHWEADFFSLAEFSQNSDGLWTLERGITHQLFQGREASHLSNEVLQRNEPQHNEALQELQVILNSWGISKGDLHCLLPANKVFLKTVRLEIPSGLEDAIPKLVEIEAKRVFPSPLEELIWNFKVLPSSEPESILVLYTAVKERSLTSLVETISQTKLGIATISAAPQIIDNLYPWIDEPAETCLFLDLGNSIATLLIITPDQRRSSYTLTSPKQHETERTASLESIGTDILKILEHATSQKIISKHKIFISGTKALKNQLLPFLQERLHIATYDLDELLGNRLAVSPGGLEFLEQYEGCSWSLLVGVTTLFQNKMPWFNLLPSELRAKRHAQEESPYLHAAMALLACALLSWLLYFQHEARRFVTTTAQAVTFFDQEEKKLAESDQALAAFQKIEEKKLFLYNLIEARAAWPQLLQALQEALPKRHLWITKLSPVDDELKNKNHSSPSINALLLEKSSAKSNPITAIDLEGLYLENSRQANVVNDFIEQLQKSAVFKFKNPDEVLLLCSQANGTAYAYSFKLRLPLRNPISFDVLDRLQPFSDPLDK